MAVPAESARQKRSSGVRGNKKKRNQTIFLICMMSLPFIQWLVFWLYVNIDSVLIAFQFARGGWTLMP